EVQRAKVALRLRQQLRPVLVAGPEEEKLLHDRTSRVDVQPVRDSVQPPLARLVGGVDVERVHGDSADAKRLGGRKSAEQEGEEGEEGFHGITMRVAEEMQNAEGRMQNVARSAFCILHSAFCLLSFLEIP